MTSELGSSLSTLPPSRSFAALRSQFDVRLRAIASAAALARSSTAIVSTENTQSLQPRTRRGRAHARYLLAAERQQRKCVAIRFGRTAGAVKEFVDHRHLLLHGAFEERGERGAVADGDRVQCHTCRLVARAGVPVTRLSNSFTSASRSNDVAAIARPPPPLVARVTASYKKSGKIFGPKIFFR